MKIQEKEIKSTYYGIGLLALTIIVFLIIPLLTDDKIVNYLSYSIFGIFKLGSIFYGQTIVKKLNRNYNIWPVFLFLFTSISLIILGQLNKLKKEIVIINLDPKSDPKNPNNLPSLTLGTDSNLLIESIQNDSFTLKHMINNYTDFINENTSLFPILAAYQLNKRDIRFEAEVSKSLDKFAMEKGHDSFTKLTDHLNTMSPEEICSIYK